MKKLNCPVCQEEMEPTASRGIYLCLIKRTIYLPEFDLNRPYWDAAVCLGSDDKFTFQDYEFPPYKILIYNDKHGQRTRIQKLKSTSLFGLNSWGTLNETGYDYHDIFTTATALELPWSDRELVLKKLKLFTTFS